MRSFAESADLPAIGHLSFVDVYSSHYRRMVQIARLTTGSSTLAEELVQDAFADLYGKFNNVHSPEAYLRQAVMSRCTSWVRRRVIERSHQAHLVAVPDSFTDPNTIEVMEAIATLSARQRAAVVLRYVSDWSEREIAQALQCRPGTVKSLLARARSQLAKELVDD